MQLPQATVIRLPPCLLKNRLSCIFVQERVPEKAMKISRHLYMKSEPVPVLLPNLVFLGHQGLSIQHFHQHKFYHRSRPIGIVVASD